MLEIIEKATIPVPRNEKPLDLRMELVAFSDSIVSDAVCIVVRGLRSEGDLTTYMHVKANRGVTGALPNEWDSGTSLTSLATLRCSGEIVASSLSICKVVDSIALPGQAPGSSLGPSICNIVPSIVRNPGVVNLAASECI